MQIAIIIRGLPHSLDGFPAVCVMDWQGEGRERERERGDKRPSERRRRRKINNL
jgi:hypothetical protein